MKIGDGGRVGTRCEIDWACGSGSPRTTAPGLLGGDERDKRSYESDGGDTDIGDSPCPPPTKNVVFKGKKMARVPLARAETYGPSRMAMGY